MPLDNAKNFAKVTLASGITAGATSITLTSGHGARLPTPPFNATLWNATDYPDPADDPGVEIIRVTAIAADTLTVTRAQESTGAIAHNTADKTYKIIAGLTAKVINTDLAATQSTHSPLDKLTEDRNYQQIVELITLPTAGNRATIQTLTGEGIVRCFQFSLEGGEFGWHGILEIYVDGEAIPSISCDIGTLFLTHLEAHTGAGGAFSTEHISGQTYGNTRMPAVSAFTLFPIPYSNGFVAKFYNPGVLTTGGFDPVFYSNIVYSPGVTSNKRLRSVNRTLLNPLSVLQTQTVELFHLTNTSGHVVWFSAAWTGATNMTYLERNYWIALDGEVITFYGGGRPSGSFVGDGTEDAPFLSGWYFIGKTSFNDKRLMAIPISNTGSFNTVAGFDYLAAYGGVKFINEMAFGFGTEPGCSTHHQMSYAALYYADISTPSLPMAPVISGVAEDEQITITVTPPLSQGSSPVTGYTGVLNPGAVPLTLAAGETMLTIPGLTNDTAYTITMKAVNAIGNSADSNALVVTPGGGTSMPSLLTDLIAYWKLDEASGTRVDSHGDQDLTDWNTVTQAAGVIGTAALFNSGGTEFLARANEAALQTGNIDFTFSLWFYVTAFPTTDSWIFIGKDVDTPANSRDYDIDIYTQTGVTTCRFYLMGGIGGILSCPDTPVVGAWEHLICWFDSTANSLNMQINGGTVETLARTGGAPVASGTADFCIGARSYAGSGNFLNGRVDEVGFWKRILTAPERVALYNGGLGIAYPFS